jgi:6-phosphofructokinase 1
MKAAHAIWSTAHANLHDSNDLRERPLSVVAIPKTMDNDVLWVWQSFGFLSAVEKAREVIEQLHTEVTSNPRLCVLQLFGSDSGFVVSHAVLASGADRCDAALIPEVDFSLKGLAAFIKKGMVERRPLREGGARIPYGLIVMAETAIPVDALELIDIKDEDGNDVLGLTLAEKDVVRKYVRDRSEGKRIQGQTDDLLRNAGLKIVSRGLHHLIPQQGTPPGSGRVALQPDWKLFRVVTNEPRHLLRAIPPSCSDVIMGQRLGTLAVDNAMAGYTDFMISQWLTEYVLVPLKLVVLGRKRIPRSGIFWKSVAAKTEQPDPIL